MQYLQRDKLLLHVDNQPTCFKFAVLTNSVAAELSEGLNINLSCCNTCDLKCVCQLFNLF